MGRVEGKVAFVTGAARGQGRSHAVRLAEEGADIIAVDLCAQIDGVPYPMSVPEDLDETVRQVEALDRRIVARVADVRDVAGLAGAVADGLAELGRLDIVCANAGILGPYREIRDVGERVALFEQVVDVNLTGVFRTVEVAKQALIDSGGGGSVVITSSLAGLRAIGVRGGYTEAKHGLVGLARTYARELAPHMIRVNSIHPTNVATPMILNDETARAFLSGIEAPGEKDVERALSFLNLLPIPYVEARDISNAVLWLASDEARYVTGVALPVDAGAAIK
ncbi:mycofactocin-coupled SDR family oxidoreductase [Pseudonocardia ailaonensis]|uniref:Mycofactocin-coupled SDR family oxidoreductase n=1 Tax=Pseudonocardia ailaonensis TaxID=367279 RepID=A0ABN2N3L1_9PSEU